MTIDINELRMLTQDFKLAGLPMFLQTTQMNELLDRLEAAEKSDAESLAMHRKARDERDALRAALRHEADCVEAAKAKIETLHARIEAMEEQEPFSFMYEYSDPMDGSVVWKHMPGFWNGQFPKSSKPLYLAPGAKGEQK